MKKIYTVFIGMVITLSLSAQDEWGFDGDTLGSTLDPAFNDTRVANGHSVEVLEKKTLDVRFSHRFGDIATKEAGRTIIGIFNAQDIRIGFDYGITDKLMAGFGRSLGAGPYTELWDGLLKYKLFNQSDKIPFSLAFAESIFITSMKSTYDSSDVTSLQQITSFQEFSHRVSYYSQIILAYNLKNIISVQLSPGLLHRNYVTYEDQNTNFVLGTMIKIKLMKKVSLLAEYHLVMRDQNIINGTEYVNPLAICFEIATHGHVFQINYMNSRGIGEGQFIPYTTSKWLDGKFRLGFTISRHF